MFLLKYKLELFICAALGLIFFDYNFTIKLGLFVFWWFNIFFGVITIRHIMKNDLLKKDIIETEKTIKKNKWLKVLWVAEIALLLCLTVAAYLSHHYWVAGGLITVALIEIIKVRVIYNLKKEALV